MLQSVPTASQPMSNIERIVGQRLLSQESLPRSDITGRARQTLESGEAPGNRFTDFLANVFGDPDTQMALEGGAGFFDALRANDEAGLVSEADIAQARGIAAGIADPILGGLQAIAQIPGLFTDIQLPTDKAANFLERVRVGLATEAEEAAMIAGLSTNAIADAHLFGELVGFTAPVVASLKMARIVTGIQGGGLSLARNFTLDTVAGIIFGSTLIPEEELSQRFVNTLRETAVFGVGGLMINGLIFASTGMRFSRAARLQGETDLTAQLERIARGERVILEEEGVTIAQLMSEEGFVASSPEAHALLEQSAFDEAIIQGTRDMADSGLSRGFIRRIGGDFTSLSSAVERFRKQFPALKFDIVKRKGEFDLHFGLTGLNNSQRSQLAREGRYAGQMVQKGGGVYSYVRRTRKGDRIIVQTIDGRTTTLKDKGITDLPMATEPPALPTAGQALYDNYREFTFAKINQASAGGGGVLSETDIVRFIRQGQLGIGDDAVRVFESPGAITHPSEIGFAPGEVSSMSFTGLVEEGSSGFDTVLLSKNTVPGEGPWRITRLVEGNKPGGHTAFETIEEASQALEELATTYAQATEIKVIRPVASAEDFTEAYLRDGAQGNGLLQPEPIRRLEDVFEAWLRERNLNPNAIDIEAFRANFEGRLREDIWALVPEADMKVLRAVQEETARLLDGKDLPFQVVAETKGFHVDRLPDGVIELRDINTGGRLPFANEEVAERALQRVVRTEKDPLFDFVTPGNTGGQGFTGGFDTPDGGVFTFEVNIAADEFLPALPSQHLTNRRDYLIAVEDISGIPLFNKGIGPIDEGMIRMRRRLEPVGQRVSDIWKGLDRDGRKQVATFWRDVEGTDLAGTELIRAAKNAGLSSKQIRAFTRARVIMDFGAEQMGLPESRFIPNYYSRIQPENLTNGRADIARLLSDSPDALKEYQFFAEMERSGDLAMVELDPEIVMQKYFRSLYYKQEVAPFEQNLRQMMSLRIKDLETSQQQAVLQRSLPGTTPDSFVIPKEVRGTIQEYINNIRGDGTVGFASARRFTTRVFNSVGIKTDPRLFDELLNIYSSSVYGAALGLRGTAMNRDAMQNLWTSYSRLGGKHSSTSLERALTQSGFDEALAAGAVRDVTAAIPHSDVIFEAWFDAGVAKGTGPLSNATASIIRRGIRTGQMSRKAAQKFLIPYGSGDQVNRAWAYFWQKQHTADALAEFNAKRIDWDGFLEDGLPFFSSAIKDGFKQRFDRYGTEDALRWIGKQAADENHAIYGSSTTPSMMQTPFGRVFGVFGQWPLWMKELYLSRVRQGTPKQIGQFWARTAALTGALANMSFQTGVNMWSWVAPLSLGFGGGPAVDVALTARDIWSGPLDRKATATRRLAQQVGSLSFPGQLFFTEIGDALDSGDPAHAALRLTLGRSADEGNFNFDFTLNPSVPGHSEPRVPRIGNTPIGR